MVVVLAGCDALATSAPEDGDLMDAPLPGMTAEEAAAFVRGDEAFGRAFSAAEGLGPIFNNVSCAACHSGDGRGRPETGFFRFSLGDDLLPHLGGPQVQNRAIPGAVPERLPEGVEASFRLPPPVFGVGLIEAIPEATILALADPLDADGDGISGRPNMVVPEDFVPVGEPGGFIEDEEFPAGVPQLGRFGRKAAVSSLLLQVAKAYQQDMGVTNDFLPIENVNPQGHLTIAADGVPDPELSEGELRAVLAYIRLLAPPAPGEMTARRAEGGALFEATGCASCHVPELRTGPNASAALSERPVRLFSDLLLHDMGDGLADDRQDGDASGREWKTAPLWGLRVMRDFLNGDAFLLHDGRARTVEEAILLHGGEAQAARDAFAALSAGERAALLDFVESR
ncbi:MAG TPA: di-heme oxidoredictase family protein [Longimicrobiales bacterium]|nr:di-heme oxidoredictase family protein [Longimicrobiales bacterium]